MTETNGKNLVRLGNPQPSPKGHYARPTDAVQRLNVSVPDGPSKSK